MSHRKTFSSSLFTGSALITPHQVGLSRNGDKKGMQEEPHKQLKLALLCVSDTICNIAGNVLLEYKYRHDVQQ